ncbi:MAG TPA: 4Fe-4S binding protein, partial [Spirochaetota bacterium]|nr:4Fe-4S binding protein [Spirochaetota bacterium]
CPAGAITVDESVDKAVDKAVVNPSLCTECGICVDECRKGALALEYAVQSQPDTISSENTGGFIRNALSFGNNVTATGSGRGMGGGSGRGAGRGGSGRGMGRGQGRGMGRGSGRGKGK